MRSLHRLTLALVSLVLLLLLVHRVALYLWGLEVIRYYRMLHDSFSTKGSASVSITEISRGQLLFLGPIYKTKGESTPLFEVGFEQSGVRPDHVRLDQGGGLHLVYLPPKLAWTTRLYPPYRGPGFAPGYYRPLDHYEYEIVIWQKPGSLAPEAQLYHGTEGTSSLLPESVSQPQLFP